MARKRPLRVLVTVLFSLVCLFALLQGVDRLLYRAEDASMPVETALPSAMSLPPAVLTSSVPTAPAQEAQPLPEGAAERRAPGACPGGAARGALCGALAKSGP